MSHSGRRARTALRDHNANNFDLLRLIAALLVLFSHSFAAVGQNEPTAWLDPTRGTWGHVGVLIFFSISGYLITSSWARSPHAVPYLVKRIFRILPALLAMTIVTAFVIGPLATDVGLRQYFTSPKVWAYPLVKTLMFVPGDFDPPGVFAGQPWPGINPSLWTLPVEFACYVTLMVLMLTRLRSWWVCLAGVVVAGVLNIQPLFASTPLNRLTGNPLFHQSVELVAVFFMGALLYTLRERIRLVVAVAAALVVVAIVCSILGVAGAITPLIFPYFVLTAAITVPPIPLGGFRGWDLSYAVYLYGFPLQQLIVFVTHTRNPWLEFGLATVGSCVVAALSWRLLEKPMLTLGHVLARRPARAPAAASAIAAGAVEA
ncbi:acyltransferase [Gryllotalpicola daejeonensis]|uniref:Acyltransferase n=1 Tax=Gryllotalpicola daejeonensis TaxID=993087 RepID=A0ABP7ZP43_9MICO